MLKKLFSITFCLLSILTFCTLKSYSTEDFKSVSFAFIPDLHISFNDNHSQILHSESLVIFQDVLNGLKTRTDIDFVIFGGDLTENNDKKLTDLAIFIDTMVNFDKDYYVIPGNNDVDLESNLSKKDFMHWFLKKESSPTFWTKNINEKIVLIGLDTSIKGKKYGKLGEDQLYWLKNVLVRNQNKFVIIAMHHPAIIQNEFKNDLFIKDKKEFLDIIKQNPQVKLVLSGHNFINSTTKIGSTLFMSVPSVVVYPNYYKIFKIENDCIKVESKKISYKQLIKKAKKQLLKSDYAKNLKLKRIKDILKIHEGDKFSKKIA